MTELKIPIRNFANAPKKLFGQDLFSKTLRVTVENKGYTETPRSVLLSGKLYILYR